MADEQHLPNDPTGDHDSTGWVVLGALLIVAGFFLGARTLGIVPWPVREAWDFVVRARTGIGIVLVGVLLIVWAQSGRRFAAPRRGAKLYRSRDDKWVAGVLSGLANYFGVEVTLLRLVFIALVVLFDMGGLVAAYIVMAIVVPQGPRLADAAPVIPTWPVSPAAPVPAAAPPAAAPQPEAPQPVAPPADTTSAE